ncbi:hypothetical protein A9Q84_04940 [Halobacteriovorax marinus]|uniref:Uncharacterized protein n=1 Tax=Halobacteriovorax marinus TaxID=97084 RepID=A0A1Y5FAX5_9BACT|nr:hypothetical protein A9Q84_04940 [Halobacteriovorax marinus]
MKKILFLILVLGGGYYYFTLQEISNNEQNSNQQESHVGKDSNVKTPVAASASIAPGGKIISSGKTSHNHIHQDQSSNTFDVEIVDIPDTNEGESLTSFNEVMSEFASKDLDLERFKETLVAKGLELVVANDKNPYTGNMTIIRTENSLPGTRYFHSQIFYAKDGSPFIQHMSFDYRASEKSFAEAVAAAKKQFKLNATPNVRKEGYYSWNTPDGYLVSVKRMTAEDLKNDPFNAYLKSDVGTIKVTKELEIH